MLLQLLFTYPELGLAWIVALILALTLHEFSHALVGKLRGDDTAEEMGRLSLNPLAHIDPMGFLLLITLGFGWARPVPYDPRNLRSSVQDEVLIGLAGPLANMTLAGIGGVVFRGLVHAGFDVLHTALGPFLVFFVLSNLMLALFNLIPIHPLDGSKLLTVLLMGTRLQNIAVWLLQYGNQLLLFAVILSILSPIDLFAFLEAPAFGLCSTALGASCSGLLGVYFGG